MADLLVYCEKVETARELLCQGRQFAAALGLGGCELNPHNFQPFGGLSDSAKITGGIADLPDAPGIGFETRSALASLFDSL